MSLETFHQTTQSSLSTRLSTEWRPLEPLAYFGRVREDTKGKELVLDSCCRVPLSVWPWRTGEAVVKDFLAVDRPIRNPCCTSLTALRCGAAAIAVCGQSNTSSPVEATLMRAFLGYLFRAPKFDERDKLRFD